ncbi:type IV secretory system conjugative DNA transfer family protein [Dyadobacter sp. BHUBP1]|uniref:type IV secretory system conjugative DNA transfer family protein n=1 Tax=Dyadobacter sp. BHUBP1 TaxID=3424178 RepID=UPI003D355620
MVLFSLLYIVALAYVYLFKFDIVVKRTNGARWPHFVYGFLLLQAGFAGSLTDSPTLIWLVVLIVGAISIFRKRKSWDTLESHMHHEGQKQDLRNAYGAKGWATEQDIFNRLGDDSGLNIGNHINWYEHGHMLTVGGSGAGKGVNLIIPALLSHGTTVCGMSLVVLDPKGENAAITAPHFKNQGYDVHVINPFHIPQIAHLGNSRWNPFDCIEPHEVKKMCDVLAYSLHNRTGGNDGSFFDNKCRQYIALYMRYAYHTGNKSMNWVYKKLMLTGIKRAEFIKEMRDDDNFSGQQEADNIYNALLGETAKTEENIFGTIQEAINILGDDALRESMASSDFNLQDLPRKKMIIYICIKHDELRYYAPWVRMFTDFLLKTLTTHFNPERKIIILLDEFAQLGYVNEFKNSPAVLRGYNVTLWPIVQELGQLKSLYGDHWETFISNATIKHWLGGGMDNTTAEYFERRMPMDIKFVGSNADGSPREVQTKLMTAAEIISSDKIILEIARLDKPVKLDKMPYYTDKYIKDKAAPNPFR